MDSLLLGTLVGGTLTLSGNMLANYLNTRKEREHWQRQQEADQNKWARDEQHRFRQELYDVYRNCLQNLSLIIAECRLNPGEEIYTNEVIIDEEGSIRVSRI